MVNAYMRRALQALLFGKICISYYDSAS